MFENANSITAQQIKDRVEMRSPHVVILGAGASRAAFPQGDKHGKILPLMKDFIIATEMAPLFAQWGIDVNQNFEEVFSDYFENNETTKTRIIEDRIRDYFKAMILPDKPTIYDYLILSLREKDVIATFNWDPLLPQAYARCRHLNIGLPQVLYLHGNVDVRHCQEDNVIWIGESMCPMCGCQLNPPTLLFPIKKKSYSQDHFINIQWQQLKRAIEKSFMITIFGYSGPKTDQEAISVMQNAWTGNQARIVVQTEFITIQNDIEIEANWGGMLYSHHYDIWSDFHDSWMAKFPRRTGEAFLYQYLEAKFIFDSYPIPKDADIYDLWDWFEKLSQNEKNNAG